MKGRRETLTIAQILRWADLHYYRFGRWPTSRSGPILDQPDRTWESVQTALAKGTCGLPGGGSLHRLLRTRRKIKDPRLIMPDLTMKLVSEWVDLHHSRTGQWPHRDDGPVLESPSVTWATIDRRMRRGELGLPRPMTLSKWLRESRSVWDGGKPKLTEKIVLRWAREHFYRFGRWPVTMSGALFNHPDENWAAIDVAMRNARRGFPYRTSLSQLLKNQLGSEYRKAIGMPKETRARRGPQARQIVVTRRVTAGV